MHLFVVTCASFTQKRYRTLTSRQHHALAVQNQCVAGTRDAQFRTQAIVYLQLLHRESLIDFDADSVKVALQMVEEAQARNR